MKPDEQTSRDYLFKPRQFLGAPLISAPPRPGHVAAGVQFVIPGLVLGKHERQDFLNLTRSLGSEVHSAALQDVANDSRQVGTLVSVAFYVARAAVDETISADIDDAPIVIVERFLGLLSFLAGVRFVAAQTQTTRVKDDGSMSTKIEPEGRSRERRVSFDLLKGALGGRRPTDNIFIALFWMRRALAERDPLAARGGRVRTRAADSEMAVAA